MQSCNHHHQVNITKLNNSIFQDTKDEGQSGKKHSIQDVYELVTISIPKSSHHKVIMFHIKDLEGRITDVDNSVTYQKDQKHDAYYVNIV